MADDGARRHIKMCFTLLGVLLIPSIRAVCPDKEKGLQLWMPGHSEDHRVTIGYGQKILLTTSATVHSIEILNGGKLVIADTNQAILLRTKHILIGDKGELHIGSPDCPYKGNLTISLFGRLDDSDDEHSYFGRKYIGVGTGGMLEIFGKKKLAWTFLNKTLHPENSSKRSYRFHRSWGKRGIILHVIDPYTGEVLHSDRFDTYRDKKESLRLAKFIDDLEEGFILSMMVNDEGSNNLEDSAKKSLSRLGSIFISKLGFRDAWTFIIKKGHPSSAVEDHTVYKGTKASSKAQSSFNFQSSSGEYFTITSSSQWIQEAEWSGWFNRDDQRGSGDWEKLNDLRKDYPDQLCSSPLDIQVQTHDGIPFNHTGDVIYKISKDYGFVCLNKDQIRGLCHNYKVRFLCGKLVRPQAFLSIDILTNSTILELSDEVVGWETGDQLVVTSTDYSMHQAEEFTLLPCPTCMSNQVKVKGRAKFIHMGEEVDGVDMRAEVGLLTRNILLRGETEATCYGHEACKFFDFDTFGGHLKVQRGFKALHISGLELQHMGQQTMGHYPVHFHMNGDVDEQGGYNPPTFVSDLAIHHSFSRCVTIHGSNGLLVKDVVGYDTLGHCFFTEDGPEERNTFHHCLGLMVRAGTLLPSDRDSKMCRAITAGAYPGYVSNPRQDCSASSTFWIANPNNNLINCVAAGSEETGFWFVFHHVPTGPSEGLYSPGHTEHTPMGQFTNNRAHSNYRITSRLFFGEPGPWFNKMQMDGDKTTIFHDIDGSVSEYPGAFLVKDDNWLLRHPNCIDVPDWKAAICSGRYAQIYIQTRTPTNLNMCIVRNEYPDWPLILEGALGKKKHYQQFQPVITLAKGYTVHWDQAAPREVTIWLINFNKNDWINLGLCYPEGSTFTIIADTHNRLTKKTHKTGIFMRTTQIGKISHSHLTRGYYYWEEATGLLFLKIKAHNEREQFAFCSVKGCERVKIIATIPEGSPPSNCLAKAYPKHAEIPVADTAMPRKIPNSRLHTPDHFLEIKLESYNTRFFHNKENFAITEVNGRKWYQQEDGVQLTVIDGHDGNVVESRSFRNSILQGVPAQLENYINGLKDCSIVLMTSKGRLVTKGSWTKVLEELGAKKITNLKEKLAFVGFKGLFHPDWVKLEISSDQAKIHQVLPVPVVNKMKL
ncbi:cell migration-inducing and hyaluronan-binding protein isoform X2 [Fundulus heteroclitus]|uniref:cell migration-inducing and hyaluronan-binding protein isoform X2 n=1 Tax=Fundulus heteroclitus TaxID=8078 RepID=UPI00165A3287|nr:cell migration-inducing and hyaluronan-binding protein isoform X2 [Fundulus heteroclitus]